jgi:hypothetical protein
VAVSTDQLAFLDLREEARPVVPPFEVAEVPELDYSWHVIPVHGDWIEHQAAVGAGFAVLQRQIPGREPGM